MFVLRGDLERWTAEGRSLDEIGRLTGRHPSTVAYWLTRHGLRAAGADRHAPKGGIPREVLADLVERGLSTREIAAALDRSQSTVRHWLKRYGLQTLPRARQAALRSARANGDRWVVQRCARHGLARHAIESSGFMRCTRCRAERVSERRRAVKRILVAEAGGRCVLCGYDRFVGSLEFHHVDPSTKRFGLSSRGLARSIEAAREEASKCVLLCANCHAEVEGGVVPLCLPPDAPLRGSAHRDPG